MSNSINCNHQWDRGECRSCDSFAENLVFSYTKEIKGLEQQLAEAEDKIKERHARVELLDSLIKVYSESLHETKNQLSEALEVIRFYGEPKSWQYPGNDFHDFEIAREDISECEWLSNKGKPTRGRKAGKRAREFIKKHGLEKV